MSLSVSDVVNVSVVLSPIAAATRNFGSLLILGSSAVIDTTERLRQYSSLDGVATDFGTSSQEYLAASLYFGQTPQPSVLFVGRWAQTATAAVLHGGVLTSAQQAIANFTAVTSGGLNITINGTVKALTGINLSAQTNLNGVASAITTALAGAGTVTWNASIGRFDVVSATTGTSSTITYATAPGSGTDLSSLLKLQTGQASAPVAGIAAESLLAAVSALADKSVDWYGLYVAATGVADADVLAVAGFIEGTGNSRIFGATIQNTQALDSTVSNDLASSLKALGYKRTFDQYSGSNPHAAASIFGRAFTVNFNGSNTTLTIKFKQEPGVAPENITTSQSAALKSKNCNVFATYQNGTAIVQEGVMVNGYFFDEVHGTDWLQNDIQTAIYNLLYTSATKIPQTDAGINRIVATIESRLAQAVANGLIAPGVWTADGFGALNTGDTLTKGYYVYAPPIATQSAADRQARKAPVIQCAIKLAGAVHSVNTIINVNR